MARASPPSAARMLTIPPQPHTTQARALALARLLRKGSPCPLDLTASPTLKPIVVAYSSPCRAALPQVLEAGSPSDFVPLSAHHPRPRCPSMPSALVVNSTTSRPSRIGSSSWSAASTLVSVGHAMRPIAIVFRELQDLAVGILRREPSSVSREVKATVQGMRERWQRVTGRVQQPPLPPYVENRQPLTEEERRETYSQRGE